MNAFRLRFIYVDTTIVQFEKEQPHAANKTTDIGTSTEGCGMVRARLQKRLLIWPHSVAVWEQPKDSPCIAVMFP